jgi:hypothetical protein
MDSGSCRSASACVGVPARARYASWLILVAGLIGVPIATDVQSASSWPPPTLRDTGLYSDWATKTIAGQNLPFSPQYPLWSDGAKKSRWLYIPKGKFIDGSNPDVWRFPVGTRLWKEFRFARRAETRFIERTPTGWQFASYRWNDDETEAAVAPELGARSAPIREGLYHRIPSRTDCRACHEAGPVHVLGITALQMSPDRDPNALHAEPPDPGSLDLKSLIARGLLRGLPPRIAKAPPRIVAPTPNARAALGYLNTNCGNCHTAAGELASLAFALNYTINRPSGEAAPALLTTVGRPSHFKLASAPEIVERICAGYPDKSMIVARIASRYPLLQMPPLGSQLVDEEAVTLITRWISEDVVSSEPTTAASEDQR